MRINIHKSNDRAFADYGWLKTRHSFNFADYFNPIRERFGVIRVLNDEIIEPGCGFYIHEQKNLEILLLPLNGELKYQDQTETKTTVGHDEALIISAGAGIIHAFGNNSESLPLEVLQIWLFPKVKDIEPRIQCSQFNARERKGKLQLIASPEIISDVLWINQYAWISRIELKKNQSYKYSLHKESNVLLIFVIEGSIQLMGDSDMVGYHRDSLEITEIDGPIEILASLDANLLIFDVPID